MLGNILRLTIMFDLVEFDFAAVAGASQSVINRIVCDALNVVGIEHLWAAYSLEFVLKANQHHKVMVLIFHVPPTFFFVCFNITTCPCPVPQHNMVTPMMATSETAIQVICPHLLRGLSNIWLNFWEWRSHLRMVWSSPARM